MEDMKSLKRNHQTSRRVTHEEQLMLGIGCPHQPERLPEPNRSQCITLLGKMLFCAVSPKPEPKDNIQP